MVALLLISATANREYGGAPFHFANGQFYPTLRRERPRIKACQQHGKNSGQEYAVKSTSATGERAGPRS
jgi:hypothetical protein